jgi:hypothetical protein
MAIIDDFRALAPNQLNHNDRVVMATHLSMLARHLGAPGDWGYGTQLGVLTIIVRDALSSVRDGMDHA